MQQQNDQKAVGSVRTWEAIVAVLFLVFGLIVSWDSHRIGSAWGDDGPQAGYFPFYIGVLIIISALVILYSALREGDREPFVRWGQLKMVLVVLVPTAVYAALIANPWFSLGIYEASAIFIAAFMRVLGKYSWLKVAAVSIVTMVLFFLMFEIWFQVPLPKGPIEAALGYA
jgi:hypothetical protein